MKGLKSFFIFKISTILIIVVFLAGSLFLAGCSEVLAKKEPTQISAEKVAEILKTQKDKYTILDVRTKEEFDLGHLEPAVLIPVDDLEARFGELSKDRPVIVYCRSGSRSARAAVILVSKGFSQVYDMTGGINAWTGKGYPVFVENTASGVSESSTQSSNQANGQADGQENGKENGQENNQESTKQSENTTSAGNVSADKDSAGETSAADSDSSALETSASVEVRYITADELNAKLNKNEDIIILDVRSEDSYIVEHIKNALNIPYRDLEGRTGELDNKKEIIVYCGNYDCGLSTNAVTLLTKAGFKNVSALEGGIESWQNRAYPVE